mgnify:FL=1
MMYHKALLFKDDVSARLILESTHPKEAKALGRMVSNYDQDIWDANKFRIVVDGNLHKFTSSPDLRKFLIGTGNKVIVEASQYDTIWGIGLSNDHIDCRNPLKWKGDNLLGFALMEVRNILRS